jgi:DNA polymerase I-like protein with 3'-5' exonuclease and polymerase domains
LLPELQQAKTVVALGQKATETLTKLGVKVVSAVHPAAVLRNPALEQQLRGVLASLNHKGSSPPPTKVAYTVVTPEKVPTLLAHLTQVQYTVIDFEVGGEDAYDPQAPVLCLGIGLPDKAFYLLPLKDYGLNPYLKVFEAIGRGNWVAHNAIFEALWLYRVTGQVPRRPYADTLLMYYALNERAQGRYDLKTLAQTLLGAPDWDAPIKPYMDTRQLDRCPTQTLYDYCVKDVFWTWQLYGALQQKLAQPDNSTLNLLLKKLLYPATIVYALATDMGIKVDTQRCEEVLKVIQQNALRVHQKLARYALHINPSSPKQLAFLLYEKWRLPTLKITATGQSSTDEETLKALHEWCLRENRTVEAEFLDLLLQYRELEKLRSTYIEGVLKHLCSDGRVRPSWMLHSTVSGRVTCSKPSLQQVPARSDHANLVRSIFVPDDGWVFIEMDFSNHELRVAAALARDERAREIFVSGRDIHREVAAKIFNKAPEEVTDAERQKAKGVNFGILYGMSPSTLAESLNITEAEAQMFFQGFYELFPKVKEWQQRLIRELRAKGYVETPLGRRRRLPEIFSDDPSIQSRAIRQALNSPVQAHASDICVLVAIEWTQQALKSNLKGRVVLTIHDSILIHAPEAEAPKALELLGAAVRAVEQREGLFVPLEVEVAVIKGCWQKAPKQPLSELLKIGGNDDDTT